jgi:ABC-type Zn uptake system ZnuABC Zn-binding protein ZnuA
MRYRQATCHGLGGGLHRAAGALLAILLLAAAPAGAQEKLQVVATLPVFAAITQELTGDLADVIAIARGDEDPHFVQARPSYAAIVGKADLFVATGLDLELWVPAVIDRARNSAIVEGSPGQVVTYSGIKLLDVPETVSRAGGDVHAFGNPHIHTDPINAIIIARNILAGLKRVDPANAATYEANARDFEDRVMRRLFGDQLVEMLGADAIFTLARNYQFWEFARNQTYQGKPLTEYLGGWLAEGAPFRNRRMGCYHKNWAYFSARFQIECVVYIEPKPGIPPTPGHLRDVIAIMRDQNIPVLFAANHFSRTQVERVASRTGARPIMVPLDVRGAEGIDTYFDLIDLWVSRLSETFLALDQQRDY